MPSTVPFEYLFLVLLWVFFLCARFELKDVVSSLSSVV